MMLIKLCCFLLQRRNLFWSGVFLLGLRIYCSRIYLQKLLQPELLKSGLICFLMIGFDILFLKLWKITMSKLIQAISKKQFPTNKIIQFMTKFLVDLIEESSIPHAIFLTSCTWLSNQTFYLVGN